MRLALFVLLGIGPVLVGCICGLLGEREYARGGQPALWQDVGCALGLTWAVHGFIGYLVLDYMLWGTE